MVSPEERRSKAPFLDATIQLVGTVLGTHYALLYADPVDFKCPRIKANKMRYLTILSH